MPLLPRRILPGGASALILIAFCLSIGAGAFAASAPPQSESPAAPCPEILIRSLKGEDGQSLTATVRSNQQPIPDVQVEFLVQRAFGRLSLGTIATGPDGTAAVPFPSGLPGGPDGELRIVAELKAPPAYATCVAEAVIMGALPTSAKSEEFPRAFWSPRAPLPLILSIVGLLTIVWSTYSYVIVQLIKIRKAGGS